MRTAVLAVLLAASTHVFAVEPTLAVSLFFPEHARPGETITMSFGISNTGSGEATGLVLRQQLPPGALVTSITAEPVWQCVQNGAAFVCNAANFEPSSMLTEMWIHVKLSDDPAGGSFALPFSLTATNAPAPIEQTRSLAVARLIRVQSTADSGSGSFRAAILDANAHCHAGFDCEIGFDLPIGSTFEPLTPLPVITACGLLVIEGGDRSRTQDRPYELSGSRITGSKGSGLEYRPVCVEPAHLRVTGLAINRFPEDGVLVIPFASSNPDGSLYTYSYVDLEGMFIGTDRTGTLARPNGLRGITSHSRTAYLRVFHSILSGNGRSGIFMMDVFGAQLAQNLIGVGADGRPLGNGAAGIFLHHGFFSANDNVIAWNHDFGVAFSPGATAAVGRSNSIHSNEFVGIDWGLDGPTRDGREELGILNAPVITSATYDPATDTTTVTGTLKIDIVFGELYVINLFSNRTANARGQWEGETIYPSSGASIGPRHTTGTYTWELKHRGDLRGQVVTTTSGVAPFADVPVRLSSEFSEGMTVH